MLSYSVYKVVHFLGIFLILSGLAGLTAQALGPTGTTRRRLLAATHGIGMALALLGGFGMLARLQIHWPWPGWVWGKFLIWIVLGATLMIPRKKPELARLVWWATPLLAAVSAYFALYKPF